MSEDMTIDEVAAQVGMTVRNVRAHQARGLLQPPRIVGRTGFYGPEHVRRLDRIRQLQDEGLNLAAIARLIDDRLTAVATGPFSDVAPELRDGVEVVASLVLSLEDPAITRAFDLGLISADDDPSSDKVRVEAPRLLAVAEELAGEGVPLAAMLDVVVEVQQASAQVARAFMDLADQHLVSKLVLDTGGDLDQINAVVEQLHVQASAALEVLFNQAMSAEIRTYLASSPAALDEAAAPDGGAPSS